MTALYWQITPSLGVEWQTTHQAVSRQMTRVFDGRLTDISPSTSLSCRVDLLEQPVPPPTAPPFFIDERLGPPSMLGNVQVHGRPGDLSDFTLYFNRLAQATYREGGVDIVIAPEVFKTGKFEDVLFTTLAPLLRRHGIVMIHAFAATHPETEQAIMLVGRSGSGKTTTGLNLLGSGWRLLGNDVVLLTKREGQIWGLPTPGIVSIRRPTFELLPALKTLQIDPDRGVDLTSNQLGAWGTPAPITGIYFPQILHHHDSRREPLSQVMALAYLMEESVDRWDQQTLTMQMNCLNKLVAQAEPFGLFLGQTMSQIPQIV